MQSVQRTLQPHGRRDWLAALMLRHPDRFMPRLSAALARWQTLSRGVRRRFMRRVAATAAGAALILALTTGPLLVPTAHAASIVVDNGVVVAADDGFCSLREAILNANNDSQVFASPGECDAGSGNDTISLPVDGDFLIEDGPYSAPSATIRGLPVVKSAITIEGQGSTIRRDPGDSDSFGILAVQGGDLTIHETTISGGSEFSGGGVYALQSVLTIRDSTISGNYGFYGGGVGSLQSDTDIVNSTLSGNNANLAGGIFGLYGTVDLVNSTISDNLAQAGGGAVFGFLVTNFTTATIVNSTISGNEAEEVGGVAILFGTSVTFNRSIVSGNTAEEPTGIEVYNLSSNLIYSSYNVFGHAGVNNDEAFYGFATSGSDVNATSDGANDPLSAILDTTLADNGGPTLTHNLVAGSRAVDLAPDGDCTAAPVNGVDQRGEPRPFDVAGMGNDAPSADTCDAGAVEYNPESAEDAVFMSTTTAGTTGDGLAFGPEDIIRWDGNEWSTWFDGSAAGLMPNGKAKHNINAFYVESSNDFMLMSFAQNARTVPDIVGKVDGMDLVVWDGTQFSLVFDGQDVGLTNKTQEKIDGVHLLPGTDAPPDVLAVAGGYCQVYLLISTQGPGKVPNYSGGTLRFSGEDVLGFCVTSNGDNTAGYWTMVLDGSAKGMPRNSTDDFSLSDDGQTLYLTTKGAFNVDSAVGGHSMVYEYNMTTTEFSGPIFIAADEGMSKKVDGLQVAGNLDD